MKNISKIVLAALTLVGFFAACSKVDNLHKLDPLPIYQSGVSPVLTSSTNTVTAALADTTITVISFAWTNPKYANDSSTTKYVLELDTTGGTFANPASKTINGKLTTNFTGREFNAILLGFGFKTGVTKGVDVRVISSYANNNERYVSNVVKLTAKPYVDSSKLTGSQTSVICNLSTAADLALNFSWTRSYTGFSGAITYVLQYDSTGKGFANPQVISVDPANPFFRALTQSELNSITQSVGVQAGGTGKLDYRIKASTALGTVVYSNTFSVTAQTYIPILRFYMPGGYQSSTGNGNDWDPPTAPELIRDVRSSVLNKMYYMYIYLPSGQEFKFTQGRDWAINYGGTGGNLSQNGANLSVPVSGFYRVSINIATMKYDIREGRMGFVGGASGAGWDPPSVFPVYAMGNSATNLFVGLTTLNPGGWKLIDNNAWNSGSNTVDETRSYGTASGTGSTLEVNGANFADITTGGRYRVIWDGRNPDNVKYEMSSGTEMRVVGDGINQSGVNDWDPPSSPQMTYTGNGIWTITIALKANKDIKFLAGNAWGAFDYEDNSGQSQTTGTPRPIKWEGGNNFKTPTVAGTYTITLNENAQIVTIN